MSLVDYLVSQAADGGNLAHGLGIGAGGGVLVVYGCGTTATTEHEKGDAAHDGEGGHDHADSNTGLRALRETRAEVVVTAGARRRRLALAIAAGRVVLVGGRRVGVGVGVIREVELGGRHVEAGHLNVEVGGLDKSLSHA